MKENFTSRMIKLYQKHDHLYTMIFAFLFMGMVYLIMLNQEGNQLAFSHMMYIPIVITGGVLGGWYGLSIGILAGLVVGPLMPWNLATGEPQYAVDWIFRMSMMGVVGLLSGLLGRGYQLAVKKIHQIENFDPNTRLHNLNYLRTAKLPVKINYTIASVEIHNCELICDVLGVEAFVSYINRVSKKLKESFSDVMVVTPIFHQVWILLEQKDLSSEIQMIMDAIQIATTIDGNPIFVDYSVGFATKRHLPGMDFSSHFIHADIAAKEAKKNFLTHMIYKDVKTNMQFEFELLSDFAKALHNGDIYMVYQPKIDLKTRRANGLEALIRWEHPTKRMIAPDQFIPAVERTAMINDMTETVFRWVLEYQVRLKAKGLSVPISINISTKNLYNPLFFKSMISIFNEFKINSNQIELEITETVLMENPDLCKKMLEEFSNFGFKIAVDDFGKGYSSLAYLAQFPINTIKIDRFFTKQILINPTTQTIVKATIDLAKNLGYEVLIEGIEDIETANLLDKLGCHSAQGYLFMKPKKEEEITEYLRKIYKQ
jgi:diguanylate cyclase